MQDGAGQISGFRFAGIEAGIKRRGGLDLGLVVCDVEPVVAGVFTQNIVRAAPVEVAFEHLHHGSARAILVNSGNANACTGEPGRRACIQACEALAAALNLEPHQVLPCSTGVIGQVLPAERIEAHAAELVEALSFDVDLFSRAILTTDQFPKIARATLQTEAGSAQILAVGKGAGMIHPVLHDGLPEATMLAYVFTDAVVSTDELRRALLDASQLTFNACSVDGDTSTNDCVLAMASGMSQVSVGYDVLRDGLAQVCGEIAELMVRDGEGANHLVKIRVEGMQSEADAREVARTVAGSLLVKTALTGRDPNWGRLLAAAGRSGVRFNPRRAQIYVDEVLICDAGAAAGGDSEARATEIMQRSEYSIRICLGDGAHHFTYTTCDIGHTYVDVNAGYRS